jgi:hypothetical protein
LSQPGPIFFQTYIYFDVVGFVDRLFVITNIKNIFYKSLNTRAGDVPERILNAFDRE